MITRSHYLDKYKEINGKLELDLINFCYEDISIKLEKLKEIKDKEKKFIIYQGKKVYLDLYQNKINVVNIIKLNKRCLEVYNEKYKR